MYVILLLFVLLFLCSLFYLTTKESPKEGFATNMYQVLPVKVTGTSDADYTLSVPNRINPNKEQSPITFGGDLISTGKLNVKGALLEAENNALVRNNLAVTGTINAGYVHKNQHSAIPPVGSIMAYAGKTDPDGWVICDGVQRTQTDGRYNELITLGIGSGTANTSYTPPNLKNQFLKGASSVENPLDTFVKQKVTLTVANMPSHKHTGTTDYMSHNWEHDHSMSKNSGITLVRTGSPNMSSFDNKGDNELNLRGQGDLKNERTGTTDTNHTHTFTTGDTGSGTAFDIPDPSNYTVNYILKY